MLKYIKSNETSFGIGTMHSKGEVPVRTSKVIAMSSTVTKSRSRAIATHNDDEPGTMNVYGKNGMFQSPQELLDMSAGDDSYFMQERDHILGFDREIGLEGITYSGRPASYIWRMEKQNTAYWRFYMLMDYYRSEVSILATIISRSVIELLRYGIEWQPKFVCKCAECGQEYQESLKECDVCHSHTFLKPDEHQKLYFNKPGTDKSFLQEANDSLQSLKSVIQSYAEMQYQNNQGYILCVMGEVIDENGKVDRRPLEFVAYDPKFVKKMFDDSARPGTEWGFTVDDRATALPLNNYPDQKDERGMQIYPAYYRIGENYGATGQVWHYTKGEVYCDNWFSQTLTYGVPIWMDCEDDVLCYHFQEKTELTKWQYGTVRGLLVLPGFNEASLKKTMQGLKNSLKKNNNSIPAIATPMPVAGSQMQVQFIQFNSDNGSDRLSSKNDIRDRLCGRAGVPQLIVTDTENSGGLNSESQQITVFDRFLMDKYDRLDDLFDWLMSLFPMITDWVLRIGRPPKADTDLKDKMAEAQYAVMMTNQLKFGITSYRNGKFEYTDLPLNQAGTQQGSMMGGGASSFR